MRPAADSLRILTGVSMILCSSAYLMFPQPLQKIHAGRSIQLSRPKAVSRFSIAMQDSADVQQILITKPRTSNAWFGVYFDVQARDRAVTVQSIKTGCSSMAEGETLEVQVWSCIDGSGVGKEEDQSAWTQVYKGSHALDLVEFNRFQTSTTEADQYTELPLASPITLQPSERRGFLVHTNHIGGLILRGGFGPEAQQNNWEIGDVTDETVDVVLRCGLPCSVKPFEVEPDSVGRAFAGSILYQC
eukprot:CAMPEP_0202816578 /NCGR_PEP_ID=MMETSP1389-20130828/7033_1 /ASSEMBLY_ACC=CAM_ASM_000865 /TAXON_ID=302021 /ORGANISM="Rhodomonas sp., Strain CCMP768" /LENGTH=244 /DNA_ID=CAMNT_0049488645 /DNA_START=19 /DNA_END=753 /DNA_ORIENTATION=-